MSLATNLQQKKLVDLIADNPNYLFNLVFKQEVNSVLVMTDEEVSKLYGNPKVDSATLKEKLLEDRELFWIDTFKDPILTYKVIWPIVKDKLKTRPYNFDIVSDFILEEVSH